MGAIANKSPAQLYALVVGALLVAVGIIGFFYSAAFGTPGNTELVIGLLGVNGWHNLVHLATGALGLVVMGSATSARAYALVLGVIYVALAIWGLILGSGESILGLVPINGPDDLLHLLLGVLGLAAGAASLRTSSA